MKPLSRLAAPLAILVLSSVPALADNAAEIAALKGQIQVLSQKIYQLQSMGGDDPVDIAILKGQQQQLEQKIYRLQALENGSFGPVTQPYQPMGSVQPVSMPAPVPALMPAPVPVTIEAPPPAAEPAHIASLAPSPPPQPMPPPAPVPVQAPAAAPSSAPALQPSTVATGGYVTPFNALPSMTTPTNVAGVGEPVVGGNFPGSFRLPGTGTSVKIGGYVKLDAIVDAGGGYGASYAKFYAIPLKNSSQAQQSEQTSIGVQQSRLNVETRTPTSIGELRTFVEGDFYGAAGANSNTNGYGFQVRHAFGSLGSPKDGVLLAGQTWSTFMDSGARVESMDYTGSAGQIFVRQPQIRYTRDVGPMELSAAAEMPFGSGTSTQNGVTLTGSGAGTPRGSFPDIVLKDDYNYASDGYVSLHALFNQINVDRSIGAAAPGNANNLTKTAYGYGLALSGRQGTVDKDVIQYDFHGGIGTGRYMNDITAAANYFNGTTGQFYEESYYGGTFGYKHYWSDQFRSNFFGGFMHINNTVPYASLTAAQQAAENKNVMSGNINLIWQPYDPLQIGIEYMRGYRRIQNGEEGDLNRIETSFIYGF